MTCPIIRRSKHILIIIPYKTQWVSNHKRKQAYIYHDTTANQSVKSQMEANMYIYHDTMQIKVSNHKQRQTYTYHDTMQKKVSV